MRVYLAFSLLVLVHSTTNVAVQASMTTTNPMPSSENDECISAICGQGSLMTESLVHYSEGNTIAFLLGEDIELNSGWPAGEVSPAEVNDIYTYEDHVCTAKLRGVTLLRILRSFVESKHLTGVSSGHDDQVLQYSGLRLTYSTTLPAEDRLLKVEWWEKEAAEGSGAYVPFDRTRVYGVTLLKYDKDNAFPYKNMWSTNSLDGESTSCEAEKQLISPLIADFLTAKSPYTIPAPESRLLSEAGGTAIVVDQDGPYCFGIGEMYDPAVYSCVPCPLNQQPAADGMSCEGATIAPKTPAPVTPSPSASMPDTPAPATPAPATPGSTTAPSGSANLTVAPAVSSAPLTVAPAPGSQGGATAAAGSASSAPLGLIIVAVVGGLVLIAIVVAVFFFVRRRTRAEESVDSLDAQLSSTMEKKNISGVAASEALLGNEADII